jgi:putative membrane protein
MVKLIKYTAVGFLSLSTFVFTSCKDKAPEDTKEAAQEINDKNMEGHSAEKNAQFVVDAYSDGLMEIEMSKFAKEKSSSEDVKSLANEMIEAHTKVNAELKEIADQKHIMVAEGLTEDQRDKLNKGMKKEGIDVDEFYSENLVSAHKDAIDLFEKASDKEEDADLKNFFSSKLPELRQHLEKAEALENKVKSRKS